MLCFVPVLRGCVCCYVRTKALLLCIYNYWEEGYGRLWDSLVYGMGTMFASFHMCGTMLVLRSVLNMLVRNASPRGPMCFRCFGLSGHCELLFLLCFIASWTWVVVSVCVCLPSEWCCADSIGSMYVGGYYGLSESGLCVFSKLCSVGFLVVGKCSSVLLGFKEW